MTATAIAARSIRERHSGSWPLAGHLVRVSTFAALACIGCSGTHSHGHTLTRELTLLVAAVAAQVSRFDSNFVSETCGGSVLLRPPSVASAASLPALVSIVHETLMFSFRFVSFGSFAMLRY